MNQISKESFDTPPSLTQLLDVSPQQDQPSNSQQVECFLGEKARDSRGRVFGGQVIGQALIAAQKTIELAKTPHSLHAYFMRAGDNTQPIEYEVSRDRDGRSFSTRRVLALQKGKPILNLTASFQIPEAGLQHQMPMPRVADPEDLLNNHQLADRYADQLSEQVVQILKRRLPIETRPLDQARPFSNKHSTEHALWFRARQKIGNNPRMHQAVLAFASDMGLLSTCMRPHGINWTHPYLQSASLDHALWFHEPSVQADDWMLYVMDTPWSGGARGFNRGSIYDRNGRLIASCAQEGLMRVKPEPPS